MGREPFLYHPDPTGWNRPPTTGATCGFPSAISGATISPQPIKAAVEDAMEQAGYRTLAGLSMVVGAGVRRGRPDLGQPAQNGPFCTFVNQSC